MTDEKFMTTRDLIDSLERCKQNIAAQEAGLASLKNRLTVLDKEYQRRMKRALEPTVSDHALLRYLERVYNLNIEEKRQEMLSDNVQSAIKAGATSINFDGVKFKVSDNVITTVITK